MKKIIWFLSLTLILSTVLPTASAFAESKEENEEMYEYQIGEMELTSDTPLTEEQLNYLMSVINQNEDSENLELVTTDEISPLSIDPGSTGVTIEGPYYTTYTNYVPRFLFSIVAGWVTSKIPKVNSTVSTALSVALFQATENMAPTYVGTWTWKAYDQHAGKYRYYATLVHYYHSNYTQPIKTQVAELHNYTE